MESLTPPEEPTPLPAVPDYLVKIVRRHAHDVRNHLNGLELDATLLEELVEDPSAASTIRQMRRHLTQLEGTLKLLVTKFTPPSPVIVAAGDLMQLWQMQVSRLLGPDQAIDWPTTSEPTPLKLDVKALVPVLCELTIAAARRAQGKPLRASIQTHPDSLTVELHEPPVAGHMPRDLLELEGPFVESLGCRLDQTQDPDTKAWRTTLTFSPHPETAGV